MRRSPGLRGSARRSSFISGASKCKPGTKRIAVVRVRKIKSLAFHLPFSGQLSIGEELTDGQELVEWWAADRPYHDAVPLGRHEGVAWPFQPAIILLFGLSGSKPCPSASAGNARSPRPSGPAQRAPRSRRGGPRRSPA